MSCRRLRERGTFVFTTGGGEVGEELHPHRRANEMRELLRPAPRRVCPYYAGCPCRKSDPTVFMVESAEDRLCNDLTKPMDWARKRRILSQSEMRPDLVVIGSISLENLTHMGLAKDDDMIQAFSTDRANQPLRMPILPG